MATSEELRKSLIDLVYESWRLERVFDKMLSKIDISEQAKYNRQFIWFLRKVQDAMNASGIKLISYEKGQLYDVGMNVTPINIEDFDENEVLYIEQMLDPIIMDIETSSVIKSGTVVLGRKAENE